MERSRLYVLGFAAIVCIVASTTVSVLAIGLKEKKALNIEIDRKQKILISVGLREEVERMQTPEEFLHLYDRSITGILVDREGNVLRGKSAEDLTDPAAEFPVYLRREGDQFTAVALPVSGKGLWSTLYGYFALERNLNTVRGITFYKHGETPGLGGEIEKDWFQSNFIGKKILDAEGNLTSVEVIKGKVDQIVTDPEKKLHSVDGISGATITSRGVTQLLRHWLGIYEPFLRKARAQGLEAIIQQGL